MRKCYGEKMIDGKTIALVLPCYNEDLGLLEMLSKKPKCIDEVIVVDNNSTDCTVKIAKLFDCILLHEPKQGYGAAFKRGYRHADSDIIVSMDADASYPLDEVERCVHFLLDNGLDFVSCSRFPLKDKNSMKPLNYVGNRFLTMVANELFGLELHDITTGMWIFRNWYTIVAPMCSNSMAFTTDIKLMMPSAHFGETHISYRPRVGKVKLNWWLDGLRMLWAMAQMKAGEKR